MHLQVEEECREGEEWSTPTEMREVQLCSGGWAQAQSCPQRAEEEEATAYAYEWAVALEVPPSAAWTYELL